MEQQHRPNYDTSTTNYFYATYSAVHNFHRLFQCRALHMSRARFPCSSPSVLVMRERSYVLSISPTLCLTSSLADNVPRPFYIQPNWTFQGTRWRQPTDFWSNWWFCSRTRWVSALGDCSMTIGDKSYNKERWGKWFQKLRILWNFSFPFV